MRVTPFGSVLNSNLELRREWLEQARREGRQLRGAVPTAGERAMQKLRDWLAALRLQFYPTSWIGYAIGALAVAGPEVLGEPSALRPFPGARRPEEYQMYHHYSRNLPAGPLPLSGCQYGRRSLFPYM